MTRRSFIGTTAAALAGPSAGAANTGPSILLISAWNIYNIGDVAITPGFLQLVKQHFSESRVTLLAASYPKEIAEHLAPEFPDLKVMPAEFRPGKPLSPEMEEAYRKADLLVLNSGMTMSYGYYGLDWGPYIARPLAFLKARELGVPYGVYGHSFDKVDPHADILYRDIFRTASFLYTRDSESLKLLKSVGVACPEMGFVPDSTFGYMLRDRARGDEFLRANELEPGKFLALIPRLDVHLFRKDGREKFHAEQTRDIIGRWVRTTGRPVAIVSEVKSQIEPARQGVYDLLPPEVKAKVRFQSSFWMPDEAQHVYAAATAVASSEMHSVILGLAAGTPSVHFYFRQAGLKQWMMRDIGLPEWMLDQDECSSEQIADTLIAIERDPAAARTKTAKAMEYVLSRQAATMGVVRKVAERHYAGTR